MNSTSKLALSVTFIYFIYTHEVISQPNEPASLPLITTYTPTEYRGGIQNWGITQDTTGYIYVANNYGLLAFDGTIWTLYDIPQSTKTRSVAVNSESNRIYVGGQRKLGYFEHSTEELVFKDLTNQIPDSISIDEIWDLVNYNKLIVANINGRIGLIDDGKINILKSISGIEFISITNEGIVGASSSSLYVFNKDMNDYTAYPLSIRDSFRGVATSDRGYLLFTYDGDIFSIVNGTTQDVIKPTLSQFLQIAKVNKVLKLKNGNIAVGTQNNGLIILNQKLDIIQHLTKNKGLNHRTVVSLYEDNFSNLWVGLNNGICAIELGSPFSLINENVNLEGTGYGAVAIDKSIYLGTSSGLFKWNNQKRSLGLLNYKVVPGSEGLVNNLVKIDKKVIVSHHKGAYVFDGKNLRQFFDQTGAWDFKKCGKNKLLGGTYNGFYLFSYRNGVPTLLKKLEGLNESSRIFEFENDTILWMTHGYKGAYKIIFVHDTIKSVTLYGKENGFPSNILINVYRIDNELIFTGEFGIYVYNPETNYFDPHPFLNKWFQTKHVSKIKESPDGNIYFIANGEAGVLEKKSIGIYEIKQKPFKKINDYLSDDLENINLLSAEEILFGAKEGFISYQRKKEISIDKQFRVYLNKVLITQADDSINHYLGTSFSSSKIKRPKVVRFVFSSPFYDGLNRLTYSYRLHPYEENWSDWSPTHWKEYTNLPSDEYVLELKAKNVYGTESVIHAYPFVITPYWYESNTAYFIYATTFLLTFITVLFYREKKHHAEKQIIHKSKDELIKSKEQEISEFSEKTNRQIQALKNENLKKEIDHKNNQLASVTMHLLSKNEFVASIRKKLNELMLSSHDQNDALQKIVKSIDKNIDEDEAWNTFVYHFDQVHGNFLHKLREEINLTPQETKLCAYLKMNMSTKDIANLMNITVRGVELARYRLRKKLGISRDTNLVSYLETF